MEQQTTLEPSAEHKNDIVTVSIKKKPACVVELDVQASAKLVAAAHKNAIKAVAKDITVPGFRKGKAPDELVLKKNPGGVDKKWQEVIAHLAFQESEKLVRIPLLHKDTKIVFSMRSHNMDGASLTLSFETDPEVPVIDPKTIQLKKVEKPEVNDEKVNETIRQTQFFFASWSHVTDRTVKEGDFVLLDVDVLEDNSKLFEGTRFEVTDKYMSQWMKKLVIGLTPGDTAEGLTTPDENLSAAEKEQYKEKKVRLTLKAIELADLPSLNDDFAQKLGVKNLEDLRTEVGKLLHKQAEAHVKEQLREQIGTYLLEHYSFELPQSLIDKEANFRLKQLLQDPQFQHHWDTLPPAERKKIVDSLIDQSKKAVRMFYLCRKIITEAKLSITSKDLHRAPNTALEALLMPQPFQHQDNSELQQAEAISRIMLEKAEDHLISHATIS